MAELLTSDEAPTENGDAGAVAKFFGFLFIIGVFGAGVLVLYRIYPAGIHEKTSLRALKPIISGMLMSPTRRKQAELLIKRNEIAIKYASQGVARVQDASRRSEKALRAIQASLERARVRG